MFEIVFISYKEPNAEDNWNRLRSRFPLAKRVDGVKGIKHAHIKAAEMCWTKMFWVVDGDAEILEDFDFSYKPTEWDLDTVHVWHAKNPINDLVYGYGGVKLLPTKLTKSMDRTVIDLATSISPKFKVIEEISNITAFNTDPFNTWKSAFRECAKLSSKIIVRQESGETDERLKTWTTVGHDRPFGEYAAAGATAGMEFGLSRRNDLGLINDFKWLKDHYNNTINRTDMENNND